MRGGEATLRHLLEPMAAHLAHPATTEVVVNQPGQYGVEADGYWSWHDAPALTYDALESIAVLSAYAAGKDVGVRGINSCAAKLPDGQRLKAVLPPGVADGTVALSIRRRAMNFKPTLQWLADGGYFEMLDPAVDWVDYFTRHIIAGEQTVAVSGMIGSSKTTFGEACIRAITLPRLITIEGAEEWQDLPQAAWKSLFYDDADPNNATRCVEDSMQLRPDWVAFGEVRGSEMWGLLRCLKIGVPLITTVHAPDARHALSSMGSMLQQSEPGRAMSEADADRQLRQYIRVVAHCRRFLPKHPGERTRYRLVEVMEVGETAADDRMVSAP